MDITAVSLLLVPNVHDKKQEIERIDHLLNQINQIGTSYFRGAPEIYLNGRKLVNLNENSQSENNIEYNHKLQNFLSVHSEPYPDADTLVIFFTNTK